MNPAPCPMCEESLPRFLASGPSSAAFQCTACDLSLSWVASRVVRAPSSMALGSAAPWLKPPLIAPIEVVPVRRGRPPSSKPKPPITAGPAAPGLEPPPIAPIENVPLTVRRSPSSKLESPAPEFEALLLEPIAAVALTAQPPTPKLVPPIAAGNAAPGLEPFEVVALTESPPSAPDEGLAAQSSAKDWRRSRRNHALAGAVLGLLFLAAAGWGALRQPQAAVATPPSAPPPHEDSLLRLTPPPMVAAETPPAARPAEKAPAPVVKKRVYRKR